MRIPVSAVLATLLLSGCRSPERSVHVTETRELTYFDQQYPGDYKDNPPLSWRRIPGTQFRILNYVTGKDDSVEIVLGESGGGVLANANRWLGQFGLTPVSSIEAFTPTSLLRIKAYLIEARGTYRPGMGKGEQEGYAMIGLIMEGSNNITLKMTGPAEEVEAQREALYKYVSSFETVDGHYIPKENRKKDTDGNE